MSDSKRIAALDGWRGIAIALVLLDHVQLVLLKGYSFPFTETGQHGVTVFFVLSGYLITSRLLDDDSDLRRFYLRRIFRLMPVAWIYIASVLLLERVIGFPLAPSGDAISCLLFYRNYRPATMAFGHFWSLSIEEQFYLVWPSILLSLGISKARRIAFLGIIVAAFLRLRFATFYFQGSNDLRTEVRSDALLIGCLLAILMQQNGFQDWIKRNALIVVSASVSAIAFAMYRSPQWPMLIESLAISAMIAVTIVRPESATVLSSRSLVWLGAVSYSLYVWQQLFVVISAVHPASKWCMILIPVFGVGSYYLIERPMTTLGRRLTSVKASFEVSLQT